MSIAIISGNYNFLITCLLLNEWKKFFIIINEKDIYIKLKKYKIKIYFYQERNLKKEPFKFYLEKIKYFIFLLKKQVFLNKNIQIYGCDHLQYSYQKKRGYFLIEEGLKNYQNFHISKIEKIKNIFFLESPLYKPFGYSKYVKKIYLTGLAPIPEEIKDKVEIINLKELWNEKTEEEKKEILDIFGFDENIINKIKNKKNILFTQPLSEDSFISEEEKIELYRKIISNYSKKDLVIKTHPREKTDYKKYFPEIEILNQSFPAELFDLLDIKFETAITIFSTAALNFSKNSKVDFYGTKVHPNLLKQWGDSEKIMKANKFLNGEPVNE